MEQNKIWDTLKDQERRILEFAKGKEKITFQEFIDHSNIEKNPKGKYHAGILKALSRSFRNLMNLDLINNKDKNIFCFEYEFSLTNSGEESILSDKQKLLRERERIQNHLTHMEESIESEQKELKKIESKLNSTEKEED